jgi:hypothetical protein
MSGAQQHNENICNLKRVKEKCRPFTWAQFLVEIIQLCELST